MVRKPCSEVNLAAIARTLDLSVSTVSRALRNAEGIHIQTRSKVVQAAETLGYKPLWERQQVAERPLNILVMSVGQSPLVSHLYLPSINRASLGLNVAVFSHYVTHEESLQLLDQQHRPPILKTGLVDGLILMHCWQPKIAHRLAEEWPTVSIVHHYPDAPISLVGLDDRHGMLELVRHLISRGIRRIGFFGFCREVSWSCSRFAAYVEALERHRISYDPENVVPINQEQALSPNQFSTASWKEQIQARSKKHVDAWICASSMAGDTLLRYLLNSGVRVPEELSVVCYHRGIAPSDLPELTATVAADNELGATALREVVSRLQQREQPHKSILLSTRLSIGQTTPASSL